MHVVVATASVTAGTGGALVTGACDVVEIGTARTLQEIAAHGRSIAQLRGPARQQRFRHRRIGFCEGRIVCEIGVAHQRSDPQTAIRKLFDRIEPGEMRDVDQTFGPAHATFHQVEQIGAGGKIGSTRRTRGGDSLGDAGRLHIIEALHATRLSFSASSFCCTSSTASVMPA